MQCSTSDARIVPLPGSHDVLTELLRNGAKKMLAQAVEAEVDDWLQQRAAHRDSQGRQQVVRNGHLPERTILSGLGPIEVKQPRVRDRRPSQEREKFCSQILPPESAAKGWRKLNGCALLPEVIAGVRFVDGEKLTESAA